MTETATLLAAQSVCPEATSFQVSALKVEKVLKPPQSPTAMSPTAQWPGGKRWAVKTVKPAKIAVAARLEASVPAGWKVRVLTQSPSM